MFAIIASTIGFGSIGATPALAGNCTKIWDNAPYIWGSNPGKPAFPAVVGGCSGVSNVQYGLGYNGGAKPTMWADGRTQDLYAAYTTFYYDFTLPDSYPYDPLANNGIEDPTVRPDGFTSVDYHFPNPCVLPTTGHSWQDTFTYRIQSIDIHGVRTWGPWHTWVSPWRGVKECT